MRIIQIAMIGVLILGFDACKKKTEVNKVEMEQINPDDSNDYRYIFREEIEKDRERENKQRKKEF
ncbi:MAG: hypothetical protein KA369_00540 [Spirochaetes bacterium]|nr:hypothetical protein [Spirochaetota bacterium]